jgi:hypothetical protein
MRTTAVGRRWVPPAVTAALSCALALGAARDAAAAPQVAAPAQADPSKVVARAEVIVLHGLNTGEGIDPRIGDLPQLKQPPFSSYNTYKLLDRVQLPLARAQSREHPLPDKGKLKVHLTDVMEEKIAGKKPEVRYVLEASINKPGGREFLPVLKVKARPGEIFFVAGQKYKGGILVLGIRVSPA